MSCKRYVPMLAMFILFATASVGMTADPGNAGSVPDPSQVEKLQQRMLDDPGIMTLVTTLQNEPEMQELLADPKVAAAVQGGDIGALLNDPRFMKLLDNQRVKEIGKRLERQNAGGER